MEALVDGQLSEEQLAEFTRELAFEFDDADFTDMVDEAGDSITETLPLWTLLLDVKRVECKCDDKSHPTDIVSGGRGVGMPCRDFHTKNWRLHRTTILKTQTHYSPCEGVHLSFEWRHIVGKWIVRVVHNGNLENAERVAKLLKDAQM